MATTKKRINISLPSDTERALSRIAKRDMVPEATKAAALLKLALEIEEDDVLDSIASTRDTKSAKFVSHTDAWQ